MTQHQHQHQRTSDERRARSDVGRPGPLAPPRRRTGAGVLGVDGAPGARATAHVTTGLVVASLAVSPLFDGVAVAVFALLLGAVVLVRVLALPAVLQALLGAVLLVAGWSAALLLYEEVWWLDIVVHFGLTGVLAAVAGVLLYRGRMTPTGADRRERWGIALTTTTAGTSLGVVWEVAEWFGHVYVDPTIYIAPGDTMGDLVAGAAGSAVAGLLLARQVRRQR